MVAFSPADRAAEGSSWMVTSSAPSAGRGLMRLVPETGLRVAFRSCPVPLGARGEILPSSHGGRAFTLRPGSRCRLLRCGSSDWTLSSAPWGSAPSRVRLSKGLVWPGWLRKASGYLLIRVSMHFETSLSKPLDPCKDPPLSAYVVAAVGTPHDHATCWALPGVS